MQRNKSVFLIIQCYLLAVCFGDLSIQTKEFFLNGFVEYLNNLPDQIYTYNKGVLLSAQETGDGNGFYYIEARLRANDIQNIDSFRNLKCSATIQDLEESGIVVQDNHYQCEDIDQVTQSIVADDDSLEDVVVTETNRPIHEPVHLDNEVQSNTGVTSGEEFVAVPRHQYGGTCMGCSSHVNPQAHGVSDLAALAIKHLDRHSPSTKHLLQSVLDVERQVQVVNGVRYILTLQVGFDNCTSTASEPCFDSKVCRISILEKTWIKLPDGSKYRAILSNNCTEEWIFGEEGEFIPNGEVNNESNDIDINPSFHIQDKADDTPKPFPDYDKIANTGSADEILKAIHNTDIQAQIHTERSLTEKELKDLEEQVVPYDNFDKATSESSQILPTSTDASNDKLHHVSEFQSGKKSHTDSSIQYKQPNNEERSEFLNEDRKKAVDDLINFFNIAGFDNIQEDYTRVKRSYNQELKVMSIAEKIHKIKKKVKKAKYLFSLAQNMVDYLNEMDLEIKTRVLLDVVAAEEESENYQNFFYIQARVVIPCDKANCEEKDVQNKICNGVIETTDPKRPHILSSFCYNEQKQNLQLSKPEKVSSDDPVLLKLIIESLKKIESESSYKNAMKIEKILQAYTRRASGTVTIIIVSLSYTDCNKTVPYIKRTNCTIIEKMDSNVCEITVHERHWLKEKKMTYSCAQRPIDERFSNNKEIYNVEGTIKDKKILEMTQEALHYLELNSNKNNRLKVVQINSVKTQLIAGLLTEIKFIVGYTTCSNDFEVDLKLCELLANEPLHNCKAQVWDRPWLEDGRQINVNCNETSKRNNLVSRKKRSIKFTGGLKEVKDPSQYILLANESLQHYLQSNDFHEEYEVVTIKNVTIQIVAGKLTRITFTIAPRNSKDKEILCQSEIWDRIWLKTKEINVTCDKSNEKSVQKRHAPVGGTDKHPHNKHKQLHSYLRTGNEIARRKRELKGKKIKQNPNLAEFKLLAQESLRHYQKNHKNNSLNHEVTKVEKVVKQVGSGEKFTIYFIAKPIECTENKLKCKHSESDTLYCHSTVWVRPWKSRDTVHVDCNGFEIDEDEESDVKKRKVNLASGKYYNNKNFKKLAEQSLAKYQQLSQARNIYKITKIHHVTEKEADGTLIKIAYSISPTECLIEDSPMFIDECKLLTPKTVLRCQAKIWYRPWIVSDQNITIDCNIQDSKKLNSVEKNTMDSKHRSKRQVAPIEDSIDEDIKYYYADRAIQHINDKTDTNNIQKLVTIHAVQNVINMGVNTVRMYIETAFTYCIRHQDDVELAHCEELLGMNHRLCYVRLWPSSDDELVIQSMAVVCDDEADFTSITGISKLDLIKASLKDIEASPSVKYKVIHEGEPNLIPSLDSRSPFILSFVAVNTNCSKHIDTDENPFSCFVDSHRVPRSCISSIWMMPNSKKIKKIKTSCRPDKPYRSKRSISLESTNVTTDEENIQNFVKESLEKLEMSSLHKYKQRVIQINSFNTKINKGRLTTIDFDVGYTSCLKYEWVDNITQCEFIEHLPRRHCISQVSERLWLNNGKRIEVNCEDDETPLEATIEFESAENAMQLAKEALKHIEAKYPHPRKLKVVRIFSLDKQEVAGVHYRMKMEVGYTDCLALSIKDDCNLVNNIGLNKFCRANIWLRPWTEHPPAYRVSCDYQDGLMSEIYHKIQSEQLFSDFLTTYKPDYINDHLEMYKRYEIFHDNVRKIHELNTQERGTARYAVTRFSDLTYEEFGQKYLGLNPNLRDNNQIPIRHADIPQVHLPDAFDWRQHDAVTEVKDQGSCGSCWAFSVTGNVEGQWKMQSGELVSLSEQELVDCDNLDEGCNGGWPDNAYRAIEQLGGLESENDYPYEAENDKCTFNKSLSRVQISGAVNISSNETDMAKWLVQNGPISIGINANAMQFYVGGVSHPWRMLCSPTKIDHGVLIVGYGVKDYPLFNKRLPYWIVKNSWGKRWGEQGYYRVYHGDGTCGVNQLASSAVI